MQQNSKVTMQLIADQLGVTKVSVSKALNNQPGVGAELKQRILEKARDLGYAAGAKKPPAEPRRIEFVIGKRYFLEDDKFYTVIYYTINKLCNDRGIRLSLSIVGNSDEMRLILPPGLATDRPNGLFLAGELSLPYMRELVQTGIPAVSIDFCHPGLPVDSVVNDNFYAAYCATMHLIGRGHREIGFAGSPEHSASVMDRHMGYLKAMRSAGLPIRESWHIVNSDRNGNFAVLYDLPDPLPSAYLCNCDKAAYYLAVKLQSADIRVPEQVSLVSFDNTDISKTMSPALTTVDIDKTRMAQMAFSRLLSRIESPGEPPVRAVMDAKLLERQSVADR